MLPAFGMTTSTAPSGEAAERPSVNQLRQAAIFNELGDDVIDRLMRLSTLISAPEGTEICRQGAPADRLFVLLEGQVVLANANTHGSNTVVEVVPPGGHFLLSAVLSGLPHLMSARSVTTARLIAVESDGLRALLHQEISLATAMLRAEAVDFGAMVRQICDLKLRTTAQRLGCYLLKLSDNAEANTVSLRLPFDKRLLAARLGCRQENLSRAFAALRSLGVETHGARVILHDIASLRTYAIPDDSAEFDAG